MNEPCPPHWTFAARAAYFGELMCPFCDHRNPAGAKFCNDCAWPLHLKPCNRCDAVNDQAAKHCHDCGAGFPDSSGKVDATPAVLSAGVAVPRATTGDEAATTTARQPPFSADALQKPRRTPRRVHVLLAAVTTILIASAYTVHQRNAMAPNALDLAVEPAVAGEANAETIPAVPPTAQVHEAESETAATAAVTNGTDAPVVADHGAPSELREPASPEDHAAVANNMSVPQEPVPSGTQQVTTQQRPATKREAAIRTTRVRASTPVGVAVSKTRKKRHPDRWQAMEANLDDCNGDFFERVVCGQRVRLRFCEGHWGKVAQCASGVVNEHGQ